MTNANPTTNTEFLSTEYRYISRDLELIFDSVRDLHGLSNENGLMLSSFSSMLNMIIEKMTNTFGQIESDLLMYEFSSAIRDASNDEEKLKIINEYQASVERLPRREHTL